MLTAEAIWAFKQHNQVPKETRSVSCEEIYKEMRAFQFVTADVSYNILESRQE
jgi:hypothetical protein